MNIITLKVPSTFMEETGMAHIFDAFEEFESIWVGREFDGRFTEVDRVKVKEGYEEVMTALFSGGDISEEEIVSVMNGLPQEVAQELASFLGSAGDENSALETLILDRDGREMIVKAAFDGMEGLPPMLQFVKPFFEKSFILDRFWVGSGDLYFSVFGMPAEIGKVTRELVEFGIPFEVVHSKPLLSVKRALHARLTGVQEKVMRAAFDMGYFNEPRGCTGKDIAAELGLDGSTVAEHLRKATGRLVRAYYYG